MFVTTTRVKDILNDWSNKENENIFSEYPEVREISLDKPEFKGAKPSINPLQIQAERVPPGNRKTHFDTRAKVLENVVINGKSEIDIPIYWKRDNLEHELFAPASFPGKILKIAAVHTDRLERKRPSVSAQNVSERPIFLKKGSVIGNILATSDDPSDIGASYFDATVETDVGNNILSLFE